jgi:hypothetical protein
MAVSVLEAAIVVLSLMCLAHQYFAQLIHEAQ